MKSQKKLLSLIIVVTMLICMIQVSLFASENAIDESTAEFTDMPDNWAANALNKAVANGLLVGSRGKISPNEYLTRAQMAAVIVRAFNAQIKADLTEYNDVNTSAWYADSMAKAYQMGVIKGSNGKMFPTDPITRQEVFVIMARAFKLTPAKTVNKAFKDLNEISDWAKEDVYTVVNAGYVQGSNGILNPKGLITRAQFAVVFDNFVKQYIKTAGEYSFVSEGNVMINTPGVTLKDLNVAGDLIIGDGVGDGNVILDNVKVAGRVVARGGGENSIIIKGASTISNLIVSKADGVIGVKVEGDAKVDFIYIADGSKISIEGKVENVEMHVRDSTVNATKAQIETISVTISEARLVIDKDSVVTEITLNGRNNKAEVSGKVSLIKINGTYIEITGKGTLGKVIFGDTWATDSKIETPNTIIDLNSNTGPIYGAGGVRIKPGKTVRNNSLGTGILTYEVETDANTITFGNYTSDESIIYPVEKETGILKINVLDGNIPIEIVSLGINIHEYNFYLSDQNGEYKLNGLPEGVYRLEVSSDTYLPKNVITNIENGKTTNITVALEKIPYVSGIVKDEKGNVMPNAYIKIKDVDGFGFTYKSNNAGEFNHEFTKYGVCTVSAYQIGYDKTVYKDITLNSSNYAFEDIEIILKPLEQPSSIKGTVTDTEGNPINQSVVDLTGDDVHYFGTQSLDGSYSFDGIIAGTYYVEARGKDYINSYEKVVVLPNQEVTVNHVLQKKP